MNLLAHPIAQGLVNPLVAGHSASTVKFLRNDGGEKMPSVTLDLQVLAVEPLRDEMLDVGCCWVCHREIIHDIG